MEEQLIEFVKRNRFLFDKKDLHYKNSSLRKERFQQLSRRLNIPAKTLQARWRTLRDKYNLERKRNNLGVTKKKWKWHDRLSFLTDPAETSYSKNEESEEDPFLNMVIDDDSDDFITKQISPAPSTENNTSFKHFVNLKESVASETENTTSFKHFVNMSENVVTESNTPKSSIDVFFQAFALQTHEASLTNIEFSTLQIRLLQSFNDFLRRRGDF